MAKNGREVKKRPLAGSWQTSGRILALANLVAYSKGAGARYFDGFGQIAPHRSEDKRRHLAFRHQGQVRGLARKFPTTIQFQSSLAEELCRKAHIFGAVDAPEPELLFLALQEVQRLLKLFHGPIKGRSEEEDAQRPSVTGVGSLDPDAIFPALIAFHAATVFISNDGRACAH